MPNESRSLLSPTPSAQGLAFLASAPLEPAGIGPWSQMLHFRASGNQTQCSGKKGVREQKMGVPC